MLEIKAFRRDKVVRIQCETEEEFDVLVEMFKIRRGLVWVADSKPADLMGDALRLLAKAKFKAPTGGDHDVWET